MDGWRRRRRRRKQRKKKQSKHGGVGRAGLDFSVLPRRRRLDHIYGVVWNSVFFTCSERRKQSHELHGIMYMESIHIGGCHVMQVYLYTLILLLPRNASSLSVSYSLQLEKKPCTLPNPNFFLRYRTLGGSNSSSEAMQDQQNTVVTDPAFHDNLPKMKKQPEKTGTNSRLQFLCQTLIIHQQKP